MKAGQRRIHAGRHAALPSEQYFLVAGFLVAMYRQHDHHRIGAREMRGIALGVGAAPGIAGFGHLGLAAALGAEAVALVPVDHAARLRQDRGFFRDQQGGNRADVDELVGRAMHRGDALVLAS
jgi:hypothetical protein